MICDRKASTTVKVMLYIRSGVRPDIKYGLETWLVKKTQERKMEVAEIRMVSWMLGVVKRDKIRNERNSRNSQGGTKGKEDARQKASVLWTL